MAIMALQNVNAHFKKKKKNPSPKFKQAADFEYVDQLTQFSEQPFPIIFAHSKTNVIFTDL